MDAPDGTETDCQGTLGDQAAKYVSTPGRAPEAPSRGSLVRQRRGPARGNIPGDPLHEPVLLRRSGRERGGTVYLAAEVLREALVKARLDPDVPIEDLEVMRRVMGGRRRIAQVLLEIRVRKGAGT